MLTTTLLIVYFLLLLIVSVLVLALSMRLGLRWAKVNKEEVTRRKLIKSTLVIYVLHIIVLVLFESLAPGGWTLEAPIWVMVAEFAVGAVIICMIVRRTFKTRFWQSVRTWLTMWVTSVGFALLVAFVIRPLTFEAFSQTSIAMAPTLLGEHAIGECPECGATMYGSPPMEQFGRHFEPDYTICENFHITVVEEPDDEASPVGPTDRFLVAKFLTPRRWDLVVFQVPDDPSVLWVMRLVGLPGETITIEGSALFVDGEQLTPPEHLAGIEYWSEEPDPRQRRFQRESWWGHPDKPAVLGEGEYFVLGDFTARSNDSRHWFDVVDGHPPYALPESHLYGVVTHIYWPISRWSVLR